MNPENPSYTFGANNSQNVDREGAHENQLGVTETIDKYLTDKKLEGLSGRTLDQYQEVLHWFNGFTSKENIFDIRKRDVKQYMSHMVDSGLKITTVAIRFRVLRAFFNWAESSGYLDQAPTDEIKEPKTPNKFPYVLKEDDVDKLLQAAKNRLNTWTGIRNYTIVLVLLDAGLRLSEVVNAKLANLDEDHNSLKIQGKGAKDRKVFFGDKTGTQIGKWLLVRDDISSRISDGTIFTDLNGNKIKRRNLDRIINRMQTRADLDDVKLTPHVLRHTAATMAVSNGLDAFSLQRLFGWEELDTAMRYVHMSGKRLEEATKDTSPVDSLGKG